MRRKWRRSHWRHAYRFSVFQRAGENLSEVRLKLMRVTREKREEPMRLRDRAMLCVGSFLFRHYNLVLLFFGLMGLILVLDVLAKLWRG